VHDLLIARCQMGMSLAFHIIFAAIGIALPLMMSIAEWLWLKTGDNVYEELAKRWSKGAAILFAVGAVSGTVLSFELGLLWPGFMDFAGEIIGMPFALEGFAFFTEAIFLGIYLYGWKLVPKPVHLFAGLVVAASGAASALFVIFANGWMNTPTGFDLIDGKAINIDPIKAMFNPAGLPEAVHMLLAAYAATAFVVAGIHATLLLKAKDNIFHRRALAIALALGGATAILQPLSGDLLAQLTAQLQPVKLAAMEAHFDTTKGASLNIGGITDVKAGKLNYAIEIPMMLSVLAHHDPNAEVKGLNDFERSDWPNINIVHLSFDLMVGCGVAMMLVSLWAAGYYVKTRKLLDSDIFLKSIAVVSPMGFIAIEAGWMVTECGRQPWIIQNVMRVSHSVTPMPGLGVSATLFTLLYLALALIVIFIVFRQIGHSPIIHEGEQKQ